MLEGKANGEVPTVLFLCVHNAGRSQMAMGFFQHLARFGMRPQRDNASGSTHSIGMGAMSVVR